MTLICVPIMVHEIAKALAEAALAKDHGADLVEFRVDEFFDGTGMSEPGVESEQTKGILALVTGSALPCIVTCRAAAESGGFGGYEGDDSARVALYERLGSAASPEHPPRYLDIELETYGRSANLRQKIDLAVQHPQQFRDLATSLILSSHDFNGRPADLHRRLARMTAEPAASVLKIAFRARSLRDSLELLELPAQTGRPTIALGIGEFGLISRILAPKFGGFLTFAALRDASITAPGQPTVRQLIDTFRFRSISRRTAVLGVVGWPVSHSKGPAIHNSGFEAVGYDGVYLPLPIAGEGNDEDSYLSLKATLLELVHHSSLHFRGCSVTIPHKENLVRLAREQGWALDATSAAVGAANTLVVERDPQGAFAAARIMNTDAPAAAAALKDALGTFEDKKIGVLGAGGVARAIVHACGQSSSTTIVVYNRDVGRAIRLCDDLRSVVAAKLVPAALEIVDRSCCDAFVNCTPVGMATGPAPSESPLPVDAMNSCANDVVVMDTVYTPRETPLLRAAAGRGWRTVDGVSMFVGQACEQFTTWTGAAAPKSLFDKILRE